MRLRWTLPSADDLEQIKSFLECRDPSFAARTVLDIYNRIRSLRKNPQLGRPGHYPGTRELALAPLPYLVVYRVKAEAVEILHIYHGAQDWKR